MRQQIGSHPVFASIMGINRRTVIRRENGQVPIPEEAWLAIKAHIKACNMLLF